MYLFAPEEAIRWRWNRNPDTPLPPEVPAGKNPPDGAIIDYFLGNIAKNLVTLEILDEAGRLVRRYSSEDKPDSIEKLAAEYPIPMYWVRPTQILSGTAGMHRFVWNLHRTPPKALEYEFPISAILRDTPKYPLGAWVLPGNYTVKLTVDARSYTRPLTVKMDPRIKTSLEDLRKQYEMQLGASQGMDESYEALEQVMSVREQLKEIMPKVQGKPKDKTRMMEAISSLDKECAELEGATERSFFGVPPGGREPENFSTLNQHYSAILGVADSADAAPTSQAMAADLELNEQASELQKRWSELREREIPDLNKILKKAGLATVDVKKPLNEELGGASDGDDEP